MAVSTNVVLFFRTHRVDDHLFFAGILSNDHAFVQLVTWRDAKCASLLEVVECVRSSWTHSV